MKMVNIALNFTVKCFNISPIHGHMMTENSKIWPEELNSMLITLNRKFLTSTMESIKIKKSHFHQILIITFVSRVSEPREHPRPPRVDPVPFRV